MSGVCAKHDRYVQPGEACPYCLPAALSFIPIHVPVAITPMCDHRFTARDVCDGCGMSGIAIMQQRTVASFWRTRLGPPVEPQKLQETMNRLWSELVSE